MEQIILLACELVNVSWSSFTTYFGPSILIETQYLFIFKG